MADLQDCATALAALITGGIYPNGTSAPSAVGADVQIGTGWPLPPEVDADMVAGRVIVSVYPLPNMERVTTRYQRDWGDTSRPTPTLTATVAGGTVTLGGSVTAGNYVTVVYGDVAGSYALSAEDTLASAAAALAATFTAIEVTTSGPVLGFPTGSAGLLAARVAAPGVAAQEVKRQQRGFQINILAPTPALRAAAAAVIDPLLASTDFLALPDNTAGWLLYAGQNDFDGWETRSIYRRDLHYWVEYGTTNAISAYPVTTVNTQFEPLPFNASDFGPPPWTSFTPSNTNVS